MLTVVSAIIIVQQVFRPGDGTTGHSSVDRGCASSLNVACTPDTKLATSTAGVGDREGESILRGSSHQCCLTDLCNWSGEARAEGYRRSEEHLRDLMEGHPRNGGRVSGDGVGGVATREEGVEGGGDGNSAPPARGWGGGSRFATVLVIVGSFSQVLWLVGSLLQ